MDDSRAKLPKLQGIPNIEAWISALTGALMTHNINEVVFEPNLKSTVKKPAESTKQKLTQLDN